MKKAIFLLAIIVIGLVFIFQLKGKKELVVGVAPVLPPFIHLGGENQNEVVGIDIEIAKEIANNRNQSLEIRVLSHAELIPSVARGDIDMAISLIAITEAREKYADFSDAYFTEVTIPVIRKSDFPQFENISTKEEFGASGKKIAVIRGTLQEDRLKEIAHDSNIVLFGYFEEIIPALLDGRVDAFVVTEHSAKFYTEEYSEFMILPDVELYVVDCAVAVAKGNKSLLFDINKTIKKLKTSGKYDALISVHF